MIANLFSTERRCRGPDELLFRRLIGDLFLMMSGVDEDEREEDEL
jgi:hypothetical protein